MTGKAKIGVSVPNFGDYGHPDTLVELAVVAEQAGFDGFFLWDHIVIADGMTVADPWVVLGAMAQATERIVIGPMVTPIPRRRPWVLARQATSIDHLSGGRLVLGVGLGAPPDEEFGTFGEPVAAGQRAEMLDEGLEIMVGMWSGERFGYRGRHFQVADTVFGPKPVQSPRIPIWVAGMWPNRLPFQRAARYDGVFPIAHDLSPIQPEQLAEIVDYVKQHRGQAGPSDDSLSDDSPSDDSLSDDSPSDDSLFEVAVGSGPDPAHIEGLIEAGATWVILGPSPESTIDDVRQMIEAGVPSR